MWLLTPMAVGIVVAAVTSGIVGTAHAQNDLLLLICKDTESVFAAKDEVKNVTMDGPIAVATGGTPPYDIQPDPYVPLFLTGVAGTVLYALYNVTDAAENHHACTAIVIIEGEPTPAPATPAPSPYPSPAPTYEEPTPYPSEPSYYTPEPSYYHTPEGPTRTPFEPSPTPTTTEPTPYPSEPSYYPTPEGPTYTPFEPSPSPGSTEPTPTPTEPPFDPTPGGPTPPPTDPSPAPSVTPSSTGPTPPPTEPAPTPSPAPVCPPGDVICEDPHMQGLRGQRIDWSGVNGGWYSLVKDDGVELQINVRLTAPLPEEFPNRQLITGLSILSKQHSVTIEVTNPYITTTAGCPYGTSACLANGGLRIIVDGEQHDGLLTSSRDEDVADGIEISASNLPVECRQFGGDKIWARMYDEMLKGRRRLAAEESFESWILRFDHMAAPTWCAQYIEQNDLAHVQSIHAIFKIVTSGVTVRLNAGVNYQGNGELDWDGRILPDLEFWQMDVGLHGLSIESESLSGILGETARPVLDKDGLAVMEGFDAFRGTVEDYRVSGPLGTDFALLHK